MSQQWQQFLELTVKETFSSETKFAGICLRTQTLSDSEVVEAGRRIRTVD